MNTNTMTQVELQAEVVRLQDEVARLWTMANRDDLTGCLRRGAFMSLVEERRRFGWLGRNTTLTIIDIDHFKKVNDTYGHVSGDEALKTVAQVLSQNIPEGALLCRMGGEEFVVLMTGTSQENLAHLEVLRKKIESTAIRLPEGEEIHVTASFGAATWDTDGAMIEATAHADALLYEAKKSGRNRVIISSQNTNEDLRKAS